MKSSLVLYPLKPVKKLKTPTLRPIQPLLRSQSSGKNLKFINDCRFTIFSFLTLFCVNLCLCLFILSLEDVFYSLLTTLGKASLPLFDEVFFNTVIDFKSCFILRVSGSQKKEVQKASELLYQQFVDSLPSAVPFHKISEKKKSFVVLTSPHKFKQGGEHLQWLQTKYLFTSPTCTSTQLTFLYSAGNSLRLKGVQLLWDIMDQSSLLKTCRKKPLGPKELQSYSFPEKKTFFSTSNTISTESGEAPWRKEYRKWIDAALDAEREKEYREWIDAEIDAALDQELEDYYRGK
jgi:hypothetical protein